MAPSTSVPHPLHDPADRVAVGAIGAWQLRQFAESDRRLAYFARRGFAHVQLWHPIEGISIVTPSRLTRGNFELCSARVRIASARWDAIEMALVGFGVAPPNRHEVKSIERWFVLSFESGAG